jgi:TetR/AcrR family transcriptional regulator
MNTRTTPARPKSRDPERTRAAIVDAACVEFAEKGFEGARTGAIAQRAGIPQGLIYHYFDGKEDLFDAVLHSCLNPYFEATAEMLEAARENPHLGVLESAVREYFHYLSNHPHVVRILGWFLVSERGQRTTPLRGTPAHDRVHELGAACIRKGQEQGDIRPELNPDSVIKTFTDMCLQWHLGRACFFSDHGENLSQSARDQIENAYLDDMVEIFLRGVAMPGARAQSSR